MIIKMDFLGKKHKAFTLVELMAVIAIIGIMTAVGLTSLSSSKSLTSLKMAQRGVTSTIKLAQAYAFQGRSQTAGTPCGYGFRFTSDSNYEIFYNPGPDCEKKNSGSDPIYQKDYLHHRADSAQAESFTLVNNVTRTAPTDQNTEIYFTIPHANAFNKNGVSYPSSQDLTFSVSGSGSTKTITIDPGGYVTENP